MNRILLLSLILVACVSGTRKNNEVENNNDNKMNDTTNTIYHFKVLSIDGESNIDFAAFKGRKILIVNTASQCGYTPQYNDLEKLYQSYKDKLIIIGFPANNFGSQEPGSNQEIKSFCKKNYGVSFPMAAKISVKGDDMAPIYHWLTEKLNNGVLNTSVTWNFNKFLIDEQGRLICKFESNVNPLSQEIIEKIN